MSSSEMGPAVMPSGECLQRSWYSWKRRRVERGEDIVLWGGEWLCVVVSGGLEKVLR